jgi:hypothetical protein
MSASVQGLAYRCTRCGFFVDHIESGDALVQIMRGHRMTHTGVER